MDGHGRTWTKLEDMPSEHELERFLTVLARGDVGASTQNQGFNAIKEFEIWASRRSALPLEIGRGERREPLNI